MSVESIIASNEKLGIKTSFFYEDNGILGYVENGTIYLNEFYSSDLTLVNKHEVLHLYEDSKQFKGTKKIIFDILGKEELEKIRNEYYLKYNLLYSEEEIKSGVLDNEIAIDIILNNGKFPININDYISNAYEAIVSKKENISLTSKVRKYLSFNVSKNLSNRFSSLDKWELLFVNEYYKGKEIPTGKDRIKEIRNQINRELFNLMQNFYYSDMEIDYTNNPYLEKRLENSIKSLEANGEYIKAKEVKENREKYLEEMAEAFSKTLYLQYHDICNILRINDYSPAFKYLMLKETLTTTYRYDNGNKIVEKREAHKTIFPHMLFNKYILDGLYNNVDKYNKFSNLYFYILDKYNEFILKENSKGHWIKFDSKDHDSINFEENVNKLNILVANTPWCTKKVPSLHLADGDFYVYIGDDSKPHIAVKTTGNRLDEIRGVNGESAQEIENEYRSIAIEFLKSHSYLERSKEWLEKEERNERMFNYLNKIRSNSYTDEYIISLVKDLNLYEKHLHGGVTNSNELEIINEIRNNKILKNMIQKINGNGKKIEKVISDIECNERIVEYLEKIENGTLKEDKLDQLSKDLFYNFNFNNQNQVMLIDLLNAKPNLFKSELAKYYNINENEIYFGDDSMTSINGTDEFPYKVVLGNIYNVSTKNLNKLEYIYGNLCLGYSSDINLSNLVKVGKDLVVIEAINPNFDSLVSVEGNIMAFRAITSFPNLKSIGLDANFEDAQITNLNELVTVGNDLILSSSKIDELRKLATVSNNIVIDNNTFVKEFPSLKSFRDLTGKINDAIYEFIYNNFKKDIQEQIYKRNKPIR